MFGSGTSLTSSFLFEGAVKRAQPFTGRFPELGPPLIQSQRVDHRFQAAKEGASAVLAGYSLPVDSTVRELISCLKDPTLPLLQWTEAFSVVSSRVSIALEQELSVPLQSYASAVEAEINDGAQTPATSEFGAYEASLPLPALLARSLAPSLLRTTVGLGYYKP